MSGTPGKTTLINVYRLPAFYLVDLPGYGFAKASKTARAGYRKLITDYLKGRADVAGLVWLLDIRRSPSAEDKWMLELLHSQGHPTLIVLTKADKIGRQERQQRLSSVAGDLLADVDQVQLVSAKSGEGIADLGASLLAALPEGDS